ncbi:NTP transferase domain-containing protein [Verrucomicrobiaceae bacterium N1E253]|uniref:NTP transferase domain-containing protein n=1 Tax=Oceaniferula marina TaxID=2748318 RepID=A0A851GJ80_9BACT|nr:nucleotidyltransferase family protein [Oceaniferula marina]NWK55167.1 NTP transferase domain-containing protein [Oceaniferula marina]
MKSELLKKYLVSQSQSVRELMQVIGENARGIALAVDSDGVLITTLTDGDVRRGLLNGLCLKSQIGELVEDKESRIAHPALVVSPDVADDECLRIMEEAGVRQIPVVDEFGHVVDLVSKDLLLDKAALRLNYVAEEPKASSQYEDMEASGVIMAGGFGTRLRPLTDHMPKPMLPINDRPLLEYIVERFERAGIRKLYVSTHYKREVIENHFRDGSGHNVSIDYLHEDDPLGTAGALGLIEKVNRPLVMTNGDILTEIDFRSLLCFHHEHDAMLTVGVRQYDIKVPFGVMNTKGSDVISIDEKPVLDFLVNAGVYVVSPAAYDLIPKNKHYNMTDLIEDILAAEGSVAAFPIVEYWLDIGQMSDYQQAQNDHHE